MIPLSENLSLRDLAVPLSIVAMLISGQFAIRGQDMPRPMGPPPEGSIITPKCPHVEIVWPGTTENIDPEGGTIESPSGTQIDVLREGLEMLPEITCQAVRRVVFIDLPPEGGSGKDVWVNRNNNQDLVYLNTNRAWVWHRDNVRQDKYGAIYRLIHEATHLAVRLIQSQQKASPFRTLQFRPDERLWPSDARQLAKNIIKENRLETGIIREWERIHRAFVSAGIAKSYYGGNWKEMVGYSVEYLAKDGFMSAYGGEQANEDIAEMVSWAIIRDKAVKPEDGACKVMNGRSTSSIQRDDSAVFTKLGFIRSLGFISEAQYKSCVGRLEIDAPAEGFHSYRGGNSVYRYTSNPRAGVGRGSGSDEEWLLANITADGSLSTTSESSVPVTVELILNVTPIVDGITDPGKRSDRLAIPVADVSYPRGIYFIGFRYGRLNKLMIRRKDNGKLILDVAQGIALVGRAGKDGIVGSVFVERVANYSGGLLSAIAGDEPVKESTRITFLYKPRTN